MHPFFQLSLLSREADPLNLFLAEYLPKKSRNRTALLLTDPGSVWIEPFHNIHDKNFVKLSKNPVLAFRLENRELVWIKYSLDYRDLESEWAQKSAGSSSSI